MNYFGKIGLTLLAVTSAAFAQDDLSYTESVGQPVEVFENESLNYRLDLSGDAYIYVDFSEQMPNASFAAIHVNPNAFSMVIAEEFNVGLSAGQYAELVWTAMVERFKTLDDAKYTGHKDLGSRTDRGMEVYQKAVFAEVRSTKITYVFSAIVDGGRAYQLLTFGSDESEGGIQAEADRLFAAFSIVDFKKSIEIDTNAKSVDDYRSETFGYRFRARAFGWLPWGDLPGDREDADIGAISAKGYAAVVMPMCWQGEGPGENVVFRVIMQQMEEDYPSDFITQDLDIKKGNARGKLLAGDEALDGVDYRFYQWIVVNDKCAYTLSAWGPANAPDTEKDLRKLWQDFEIRGRPTALAGQYENQAEREVNAYLVNALGLHYHDTRGYRDAFRFFAQASDLSPSDATYLTNALASLVAIDAYQEAYDWLGERLEPLKEDQVIRSWDAWLAYQTGDPEKALRIYTDLFANDYRDDDDFSVYMTLLADEQKWDLMESRFAAYTAGGATEAMQVLHSQLLGRSGRFEDALAILDQITEGRPFNVDVAYERMSILNEMGNPAEVLLLANQLIENGYRSLESYYYKGEAEFRLRSYRKSRESFEKALSYSPTNAGIKEYLDEIDNMLGEGDTTTIASKLDPVSLPRDLQKTFNATDFEPDNDGYGSVFLSRIRGYDFDGSDSLQETKYWKILILDDNGVERFSTLQFNFDPGYEQLFVNSVVVRDMTGAVLAEGELNSYYITNNENSYAASTEKTVHLPVPSLGPGVVIEAIVTKRTWVEEGTFPLETVYFSSDRPNEYSALFVKGKHNQLHYQLNDVGAPRKRSKALVWEIQHPVVYRWEPLQPYFDQIIPWIRLGTVSESWQDAGEEYLGKIADKLDVEKTAEKARQLVDGVESQERQIAILSAYVQGQIRYEAIEFGRRAYIPKLARETLRDRYGDCKDHAVLLYSLLQAVGIDASLALVNLTEQVTPTLPNTDQFDHMIVSIHGENGRLFVDATDKDLQLGRLSPRGMAGNYALELGSTPGLLQIPDYESSLTGLSVERVVEVRDDKIDISEIARFSGYQAADIRSGLRAIETSGLQTWLQGWIASVYSDAELTEHFVDNVFDANNDLILEIRYMLPIDTDGSFDVPGFLESYYLEYARVTDRRFPFEHFYPLRVSAVTSVKPPSGRGLNEATSKPDAGESKFGNWRRTVSHSGNAVEIRFDYVASEARFDAGDYSDFTEFQRKAIDSIEQPLVLGRPD